MANTVPIEEVLSWSALGKVVTAVKPGIPDVWPEGFRKGSCRKEYRGKGARYINVKGQRKLAQRVEYGAPAKRTPQIGIADQFATFMHSYHELEPFDWLLLQRLRSYESYEANGAMEEVSRQLAAFGDLFDNLEIASLSSALTLGHIYYDGSGNLLPSSSGATLDVDMNIPANNKGQLNGLISASWATASTDIPLQLRQIRKNCKQATGYDLYYAFYGMNIPSYLFGNTQCQNYFVRDTRMRDRYVAGSDLGEGMTYNWRPIYDAFFEDQTGTIQQQSTDDMIIFCPKESVDWYEFMVGSYGVPTSFNPMADAKQALASIQEVFGRFAYAVPGHNSATPFAGNTWMPNIKVPTVVYIADTTP